MRAWSFAAKHGVPVVHGCDTEPMAELRATTGVLPSRSATSRIAGFRSPA